MFTRCPECETVFQIEIEELKAAEGKVCCGECDRVFNALVSLTDKPDADLPERGTEAQATPEGGTQEETQPVAGDLFGDLDEAGGEVPDEPGSWAPDATPEQDEASQSPEQRQWEQKLAELGLTDQDDAGDEHEVQDAGSDTQTESAASEEPADWLKPETGERRTWPWAVAALLAGFALAAQAVHYWREDLATLSVLEPWIAQFYKAVGNPLPEHWDVRAYLVEKGAVSDHPEMSGALLVNAVIGNATSEPMPHPLLKVTLLDRWGEAIGERFFAPGEYLQDPAEAKSPIPGGVFAEASVLIVDPGQGAVSYGIDACLRDAANRLTCAHQDGF